MRFAASPLTTNGDPGAICAEAVAVKINATQSKLTQRGGTDRRRRWTELIWTVCPTLKWIRFIVPPRAPQTRRATSLPSFEFLDRTPRSRGAFGCAGATVVSL